MDEHVRFSCPKCRKRLKATPEQAGRRARCSCGQSVIVPSLEPPLPRGGPPIPPRGRPRVNPVAAPLPQPDELISPPSPRRLWPWFAGGGVTLVLVVGVGIWFAVGKKPPEPAAKPEVAARPVSPPKPVAPERPKDDGPASGQVGPKPPSPDTAMQAKLAGVWELAGGSTAGKTEVTDWIPSGFLRLVIESGRVTIASGDMFEYAAPKKRAEYTLEFDVSRRPPVYTLTPRSESADVKSQTGIFRLDGDCLILCSITDGGPPADFDLKPGIDVARKHLECYVRIDPLRKVTVADLVGEWVGQGSMMGGNTLKVSKDGDFEAGLRMPTGDSLMQFSKIRSQLASESGEAVVRFSVLVQGAFGVGTTESVALKLRLSADNNTLFLADEALSLNPGWQFVLKRKQ